MGDKEKNRVDNCGRLFSSAHENAVITASYGSATERVKLKLPNVVGRYTVARTSDILQSGL
jgi:hypothetical protein